MLQPLLPPTCLPRLTHPHCSAALDPCHLARRRAARWSKGLLPAAPPPHHWETQPRREKAQNQEFHRYRGTKVVLAANTFTSTGYRALLPRYHHDTFKLCEDNPFVGIQVTLCIATSHRKWTKKCYRRCNGLSLKPPYVWVWVWMISMLINYPLASPAIFFSSSHCAQPSCSDVMQKSSWVIETSKPLTVLRFSVVLPKGRVGSHGFYASKINMFMQLRIIPIQWQEQ